MNEIERIQLIQAIINKRLGEMSYSDLQVFYRESMADWYADWGDEELLTLNVGV